MLIEQRTGSDCMIACLAMATGVPYDRVLELGLETGAYRAGEGCRSEGAILKRLGYSSAYRNGEPVGDFVTYHRSIVSPEYFRSMAWGRKAIFSVPSLNIEGGWHAVFYDGRRVLDPNPPSRKRYLEFAELRPDEITLFRVGARPRRKAAAA